MRKFLLGLIALVILIPALASAATLKSAPGSGTASVNQNETVKNAYLAGNSVNLTGNVQQDVIAAGNTLNLTGSVGASLMAAGNAITISGPVGNSARVAGNNINVQNSIGADFLAAGNSIVLGENATVGDDLLVGGATVDLFGTVKGNARLAAGQINIDGKVDGNVIIKGGNKVTIGDNAIISGNLNYEAQEQAVISPSAKVMGETNFTKIKGNQNKMVWGKMAGVFTLFSIGVLITTFLTLWLLIYLFPNLIRKFIENGTGKFLSNMGMGFVYLVVMPIAAIILCVTLIGLPLGLLTLSIYAIGLILAKLLTPIFVGSLLFKWLGKNKVYRIDWLTVLVGVLVTAVVGAIPFLGSLAIFLIFLIALSQIGQSVIGFVKSQR